MTPFKGGLLAYHDKRIPKKTAAVGLWAIPRPASETGPAAPQGERRGCVRPNEGRVAFQPAGTKHLQDVNQGGLFATFCEPIFATPSKRNPALQGGRPLFHQRWQKRAKEAVHASSEHLAKFLNHILQLASRKAWGLELCED